MSITLISKSPSIDFALPYLNDYSYDWNIEVEINSSLNLGKEGYEIKIMGDAAKITGHDDTGAMYGMLDLAEQLSSGAPHNVSLKPYLEKRGFKFNIPLDVRTPSYSDGSDASRQNVENMWDMDFWKHFLDQMAIARLNTLSLWNLHPFPSMVKVDDYPDVALKDVHKPGMGMPHHLRGTDLYDLPIREHDVIVKRMSIDEKIKFWQDVMQYAHDRGVKLYICTWNIFVYGTEDTDYGITVDQKNQTTVDYFRKTIAAMLRTYPLLAGIGITSGENMDRNLLGQDSMEHWMRRTYGQGIMDALRHDPERDFTFIHRSHETSMNDIFEPFGDFPHRMDLSFKYSQAHMYGAVKPTFGDNFFKKMPAGIKTWLTVRDDDFYLYRHCHPDFARDYIKAMPIEKVRGMYMGPDGYIMGREYVAKDGKVRNFIDKMWFNINIWGRLGYNPKYTNEYFYNLLKQRYPQADKKFYNAFMAASNIIPELNRVHWHDLDFQWYPEGNVSAEQGTYLFFHSIRDFARSVSAPGSGYMGIGEYCSKLKTGELIEGITPPQAAANIKEFSKSVLNYIKTQPKFAGEMANTLDDMHALGLLGRFYGYKVEAGVEYGLYLNTGDESYKQTAYELAQKSYNSWVEYAEKWYTLYKPQFLTRIQYPIDFISFCEFAKNDMTIVENR